MLSQCGNMPQYRTNACRVKKKAEVITAKTGGAFGFRSGVILIFVRICRGNRVSYELISVSAYRLDRVLDGSRQVFFFLAILSRILVSPMDTVSPE